ncbi:MAG TPA: hydrogenase expression/formation protein HypE [Acidimicrobiales bacterium]|nr:hydrogenase expression/formation protein HypE [Acidimicrobiales bacterium]
MSGDDLARRDAVLARVEAWRRRAPTLRDEHITMAHGAGGSASRSLLEAVFQPAFSNPALDRLEDGAVLDVPPGHRLAMSTDAFVVTPRRFPGGSLGDLAVNGTINDLAAMGAVPTALAVSFVLEEGLAVAELRELVADVAAAAAAAGAPVVTGDTKVVERGAADGCYVTTTGVGLVPTGLALGAASVRPGDAVVLSGPIGDHGVAVMIARGDLALQSDVRSDTAPLHGLVAAVLDAVPDTRWLRDPTRGGVASALNELAVAADLGVRITETRLPVRPAVAGACELLGLDPLHIANEGKMIAVVPADRADDAVAAMVASGHGEGACVIGSITDEHPNLVVVDTPYGGTRILDMLVGDPLPRIC